MKTRIYRILTLTLLAISYASAIEHTNQKPSQTHKNLGHKMVKHRHHLAQTKQTSKDM